MTMTTTAALRAYRRQVPDVPLRRPFALLRDLAARTLFRGNLEALMLLHSTDKATLHRYAEPYARYFAPIRRRRLTLLEIGIGGYAHPSLGGGSLRMWRNYFPRANIHGIDVADKSPHDSRRITTHRGSQSDPDFLDSVLATTGPPDIVIDDGSHRSADVIATFRHLFPRMAESGFYVVEDTQTSYWPDWGGDDTDPDGLHTTAGFFKSLVHGLNYEERPSRERGRPSDLERTIRGIAFHHNLIVVERGPNREGGRYRTAGVGA